MVAATTPSTTPDPTVYPIDDAMGEGLLQRWISNLLQALLVRLFARRGETALVGANQFVYWVQFRPTDSVAPDVYVLPGVAPDTRVDCWKTWETGVVPSFALEIVSRDRLKDYEEAPRRYEALGIRELVLFDPDAERSDKRVRWQVFRPLRRRGFCRVEATDADRVYSRVLKCWLLATGEGSALRVRVATGEAGEHLLPTTEEERDALTAQRDALTAQRDALTAQRDALAEERDGERRARLALEAELARLRAKGA